MNSTVSLCHLELFYLGLDVALGEVLDVGQLEVHLSQPHQDAVAGRLKLLPLADEVLTEKRTEGLVTTSRAVSHSENAWRSYKSVIRKICSM